MAQIFLGVDLVLLSAELKYDDTLGVDIYGHAMLKNSRGQVAQVSFGFDFYYQCHYELLGSKGKLVVERAFTSPPGFKPRVRIEYQDTRKEFTLDADNQYVNMCHFFADAVRMEKNWQTHQDALLAQAQLLEAIRKKNRR